MGFNQEIKIGNKKIGGNNRCFIIAEIGANHDQKVEQGKKLIDLAAKAGVDAVKFQSFTVENWMSKNLTYFPTMKDSKNLTADLKKCELPPEMYQLFQEYAEQKGLICFSSPSHIADIDELEKIGVPLYKFGSVQITDLPTIEYAARKNKPIIISAGAASLAEIEDVLEVVRKTGNRDLTLLHCTIQYPAQFNQLNLNVMAVLHNQFNITIGYSDHTLDPVIIPVSAVALGAKIIEKHITLDRKKSGPDHHFALEPEELARMVEAIRGVEQALGSGQKILLEEEREIIKLGRRSIIAKIDIPVGAIISEQMITLKRPGFGISPKQLGEVVGRQALKDIKKDDLILWDSLK